MPRASVSIVSHNQLDIIRALLADLSGQSCATEIEILLTLNVASETFDTAEYPTLAIRVIRNDRSKGFGRNHNQAFGCASSPVFCVLNPDIRLLDLGALAGLISAAEAADGFVAPEIVNQEGVREDSIRINLTPWAIAKRVILGRRDFNVTAETRVGMPFFWVAGMFLVCRSEVYARLGGFDERFFMYCEDFDLSARAYLAGFSIRIIKDIRVVHDARRASRSSVEHLRWHLRSLMRVWTSGVFWRLLWSQRGFKSSAR